MSHPHLRITFDETLCTWTARAWRTGPDGLLLEAREASGHLEPVGVLRKDKDGEDKLEVVPVTAPALLGTGLAAALDLAEGWEGPRILEADARQNGILKVGLPDGIRTGRLEEGEQGLAHAREAWRRIAEALTRQPPSLQVRWVPAQASGCPARNHEEPSCPP